MNIQHSEKWIEPFRAYLHRHKDCVWGKNFDPGWSCIHRVGDELTGLKLAWWYSGDMTLSNQQPPAVPKTECVSYPIEGMKSNNNNNNNSNDNDNDNYNNSHNQKPPCAWVTWDDYVPFGSVLCCVLWLIWALIQADLYTWIKWNCGYWLGFLLLWLSGLWTKTQTRSSANFMTL